MGNRKCNVCGEKLEWGMYITSEDQKISELSLTVRTKNALRKAGIQSVKELLDMQEKYLRRMPGLGRKSIREVIALVELNGLEFKQAKQSSHYDEHIIMWNKHPEKWKLYLDLHYQMCDLAAKAFGQPLNGHQEWSNLLTIRRALKLAKLNGQGKYPDGPSTHFYHNRF